MLPLEFDQDGVYVLLAEEITRGSANGGVYDGDPANAPSETLVGAPQQLSIEVGSQLTLQLGAGVDTAKLRLFVWGDAVYPTTQALHGIVTPGIFDAKTKRASMAAESTAVREAVQALPTFTPAESVGDLEGSIDDLIGAFNAHLLQSGVHASDDTDHAIPDAFLGATTTAGQREALSKLARSLEQHVTNTESATDGVGSAAYHSGADWTALPHVTAASDQAGVPVMLADLWRRFEAHRVNDAAHVTPDTVNSAGALAPLTALHGLFLQQIFDLSPEAPENEHSAMQLLISSCGFQEAHR
jgi:hypothetical protein